MALIFKCDRCEKLESSEQRNPFLRKKAGSVMFTVPSYENDENNLITHDICKECADSFKEWLKNPPKDPPKDPALT